MNLLKQLADLSDTLIPHKKKIISAFTVIENMFKLSKKIKKLTPPPAVVIDTPNKAIKTKLKKEIVERFSGMNVEVI